MRIRVGIASFSFVLAFFALAAGLPAAGVVNGDFETGGTAPWTVSLGGAATAWISPTVKVVGPGWAPNTNNMLPMVKAGSYSAELYSGWGDTGHLDYAQISQSFYVDPTTTILQMNVAAVLNGAHASTPSEDSYFEAAMYSGATLVQSQLYYYANSPAALVDPGIGGGWKFLPWTILTANLSAYVNTTITVQFSAHDCNQGGHDAWAYVDGFQLMPTYTISPTYTQTPTATITRTMTATPTMTATFTASPTVTPSSTSSATPTLTASATVTPSPTITATFSISPTFSVSPTITPTFSISPTFTITKTPVNQGGQVEIRGLYPNPFAETVHAILVLKNDADVEITVYDVAGEPVYSERTPRLAGVNVWDWNGSNNAAARLASGAYVIRASCPDAGGEPSYMVVAIVR